jgi:hypothetical protein
MTSTLPTQEQVDQIARSLALDVVRIRMREERDWADHPAPLRNVARAFADLQQRRRTADYDNHRQWTETDTLEILGVTQQAFIDWQAIPHHPMTGNYLIAMLLGK